MWQQNEHSLVAMGDANPIDIPSISAFTSKLMSENIHQLNQEIQDHSILQQVRATRQNWYSAQHVTAIQCYSIVSCGCPYRGEESGTPKPRVMDAFISLSLSLLSGQSEVAGALQTTSPSLTHSFTLTIFQTCDAHHVMTHQLTLVHC